MQIVARAHPTVQESGMLKIFAAPGRLLVNRIPEQDVDIKLPYKLALGRVMKTGIPEIKEGAIIAFALEEVKEFTLPEGEQADFEPSPLGLFRVGEEGIVFEIRPVKD
jgi:hypothetical protein